jgi:hypothetical protein
MTILGVIIAVVLAILAFKFVKGVIKFALLAIILIIALWFVVGAPQGASSKTLWAAVAGGGK